MTAVLFISMVILLFAGVPIAFVLGGSSVLALAADSGTNMSIVIQRMFSEPEALLCWQFRSSFLPET